MNAPSWFDDLNLTGTGLVLDLLIVVVTIALMRHGWRRGGLRALASLLGLSAGLIAASYLAGLVVPSWAGESNLKEFAGTATALGIGALCGFAIGRTVGNALTRTWNPGEPPLLDRGLGVATYGAVGLIVCILAIGPVVGDVASDSLLVRELSDPATTALSDHQFWSSR